jgi:hypothetical protein
VIISSLPFPSQVIIVRHHFTHPSPLLSLPISSPLFDHFLSSPCPSPLPAPQGGKNTFKFVGKDIEKLASELLIAEVRRTTWIFINIFQNYDV